MCYQRFIHCSCGHSLLEEAECELAPNNIPFPIKLQCPNYQAEKQAVNYPCGRGRFYCNDTQERSFFNKIHTLVDEMEQLITDLNNEISGMFGSQAIHNAHFGPAPTAVLPYPNAIHPNRLAPLQNERDEAIIARNQGQNILESASILVHSARQRQTPPARPLANFQVSHRVKDRLTNNVLAVVDAYENAQKDPNAIEPPPRRPLENLANPGMERLTAAFANPPAALTRQEVKDRVERKTVRRCAQQAATPARRTPRAYRRVNYADVEDSSLSEGEETDDGSDASMDISEESMEE